MARILIVEDETSVAAFLSRTLTADGHAITTARDGKDGIAKIKASAPDLVIMDLSLPKMNGWDATRRLKGDPATKSIPILALTSAVTSADRDEAYNAGCDAYETKPIDLERLRERVRELIPV